MEAYHEWTSWVAQNLPKTYAKIPQPIDTENGLIALLEYPARPAKATLHEYKVFDIIYINKQDELVLLNQKKCWML